MPELHPTQPRPLPPWLILLGSAFAVAHVLALGLYALAAPSGPWSTPFGEQMADGPTFANSISSRVSYPYYLWPLRMTHNYHFQTNRVTQPAVYFEITLKDVDGSVIKTLKYPDEKANFWVRQRQNVLAQELGDDQPVPPRGSDVIAGVHQKMPTIEYWDMRDPAMARLKQDPHNEAPRDPGLMRPSEKSKSLAQAYMRYACREYGAASAELVRSYRNAVMPMYLFMPKLPPNSLSTFKNHFGEYRREK